jgi:hypothetical protein
VGQLLRELDQNHSDSPPEEVKMDEDSQEEKPAKRSEPGENPSFIGSSDANYLMLHSLAQW